MQLVPAFDHKPLTISQLAALAGRSYSWAWNRVANGSIESFRDTGSGRLLVTASEARRAISEFRRGKAPSLRLVVDNTAVQ